MHCNPLDAQGRPVHYLRRVGIIMGIIIGHTPCKIAVYVACLCLWHIRIGAAAAVSSLPASIPSSNSSDQPPWSLRPDFNTALVHQRIAENARSRGRHWRMAAEDGAAGARRRGEQVGRTLCGWQVGRTHCAAISGFQSCTFCVWYLMSEV